MYPKRYRNKGFQSQAWRSKLLVAALPVLMTGLQGSFSASIASTAANTASLSETRPETRTEYGNALKDDVHFIQAQLTQQSSSSDATTLRDSAWGNAFPVVGILSLIVLVTVLPLGLVRGRQRKALVEQMVSSISAFSQQIFSAMAQQERIASQQAASVNETTTTMDELEASCRQSSEQAQAAVTAAKQALQLTESGTQAVEETLGGMFLMEKKVEAIAEQIVRLSEQANQIGGISQLVSELANQTNMLALNSSVEAVRAGEHGKGFAVVANEIRKLSDQSQQSAEKISVLVAEIQKAINSTVMVTDEGTKTVKTSVQTAQRTEQTFMGVAESVNKVVLNNQQVSLNLRQQVDAIRQVVEAMENINKGANETATGLFEIQTSTKQLNDMASALRKEMV
jgi:methyl-accepting chemotaxis protein